MRTRIIAHRGWSARYPENTLTAFCQAMALPIAGIECDVRLTADGVPVIMHDATVNRTTDGSGEVSSLSFADLRKLDASGRFGNTRPASLIPSLSEMLQFFSDQSRPGAAHTIDIELKPEAGNHAPLVDAVLRVASDFGRLHHEILFTSFDVHCLSYLKTTASSYARGLLANQSQDPPWESALDLGCTYIALNHAHADPPSLVRKCHDAGLSVAMWTVDRAEDIRRMFAAEVDLLITNVPDLACRIRSEH